jgi:hypothetical protein
MIVAAHADPTSLIGAARDEDICREFSLVEMEALSNQAKRLGVLP